MPDDQVQKIHEEFGVVAIDGLLAPFAESFNRAFRED